MWKICEQVGQSCELLFTFTLYSPYDNGLRIIALSSSRAPLGGKNLIFSSRFCLKTSISNLHLRYQPTFKIPDIRAMSTTKDAATQSDITQMKREPDGSFKRADASFRNIIEKGGKFAPEKGQFRPRVLCGDMSILRHSNLDRYHLYVSYACRKLVRGNILQI